VAGFRYLLKDVNPDGLKTALCAVIFFAVSVPVDLFLPRGLINGSCSALKFRRYGISIGRLQRHRIQIAQKLCWKVCAYRRKAKCVQVARATNLEQALRKFCRCLAVAVTVSLSSACVVFPVPRDITPEISGTLLNDGVPVTGSEIVLIASSPPSNDARKLPEGVRQASTVTDRNGRFTLGPLTEVKMVHPHYGDELIAYSLLIRHKEKQYVGYSSSGTGLISGKIDGTCDLAEPKAFGNAVRYCDHNRLKK